MLVLSPEPYQKRDMKSLLGFLQDCQAIARKKQHYQIASISLRSKHIDPLAVLQTIWEPHHNYFYLENPLGEEAISGAEAVVKEQFSGTDRFQKVKQFASEVLENMIVIEETELQLAGPHFFCAFSFFDQGISPFPGASVFLPTWQVSCKGGHFCAVANVKIDIKTMLLPLAVRVWNAYQKFSSFDYLQTMTAQRPLEIVSHDELGGFSIYKKAIERVLHLIRSGRCQKIVLARALDLVANIPFSPLNTLNALREGFPNCFPSAYGDGLGNSFISITPERLVKIENNTLKTEAMAGTIKRGSTAQEDASLAKQLLTSKKDREEHGIVVEHILKALRLLDCEPLYPSEPKLKKLNNLQHLYLPIESAVKGGLHPLDIVERMHPTPAVGVTPSFYATEVLKAVENFDRSLYAGPLGWFNYKGDADFVVGIRSALIYENKARLFAGSGIVADSELNSEYQEIELKLRAILGSLC